MAPSARRRVELGDALGDVLSSGQGRVREAAERLLHEDDVRPGGVGRAPPDEVLVRAVHFDAVVEKPLRETIGLGVASLGAPGGDQEGLRILDHPVVLVFREAAARDERVVAAVRPSRARHSAAEDLQLVVENGVPVLDPEVGRRVEDDVLLTLGSQTAAARRVVAHLDRGAVDAEERAVGLAVERAPVVPALGDGRVPRRSAAPPPRVPLVHGSLDGPADRLDGRLVGV
jgi:hypothetical protein